MAFIKLAFKPGVNRDNTDYANEGGWYACDKVRFRSGQPQKIGGWVKAGGNTFLGVARQFWDWVTTYSDSLLAVGTDVKVYIALSGKYYDITPLREVDPIVGPLSGAISTTTGSNKVTVTTPTPHGASVGAYVTISGVTPGVTIGGIPAAEINGNHKITDTDTYTFKFETTTVATSPVSGAGGAAIMLAFEIVPGYSVATSGYGWGTGTWGGTLPVPIGTPWGMGSTVPIKLPQRDWWFDNFDNDLVMNIRNGPIYWWQRGSIENPEVALEERAITQQALTRAWAEDPANGVAPGDVDKYVAAVPQRAMQVLVSQQDKHLIAFGATPFSITETLPFDPLLIRWTDQDVPEDWWPTSLNSSGFLRVSRGSKIIRALPTRQEILIWTDSHLMTLQFLGTTDVFGLQEYADNISIISPRAVTTANNTVYWMGNDKFYAYTGRVETLPCTLREHVFGNISNIQSPQIVCGTNEGWNEVWWFYPTINSEFNNAYVVYNYHDDIWYYGSIERTAWLDSPLRQWPIAANTKIIPSPTPGGDATVMPGIIYAHENGVDDDGLPMFSYIQSSDFDLDDGDQFMLIRRILPDVDFSGSINDHPSVLLSVRPRNFPGGAVWGDPADTQRVISSTFERYNDQVFMRARARQMAFKIQSDALGVQWQLGNCRADVRPDGNR